MDSHGQVEQRVVWCVVDSDIGPLLLAATREGLVSAVFHATDAVRDRAVERLVSRLGTEPVEAPGSRCWPRRYVRSGRTSRVSDATSTCRLTGR